MLSASKYIGNDIHKCWRNVLHSDERTRLNCSMVFVSTDIGTFRLVIAVCYSHVTVSVVSFVTINVMNSCKPIIESTNLMYFQYLICTQVRRIANVLIVYPR